MARNTEVGWGTPGVRERKKKVNTLKSAVSNNGKRINRNKQRGKIEAVKDEKSFLSQRSRRKKLSKRAAPGGKKKEEGNCEAKHSPHGVQITIWGWGGGANLWANKEDEMRGQVHRYKASMRDLTYLPRRSWGKKKKGGRGSG